MCNDVYYHYNIIQNNFTALKVPILLILIPLSLLWTLCNHWSFYCLHSLAFSRMSRSWNHTACCFVRINKLKFNLGLLDSKVIYTLIFLTRRSVDQLWLSWDPLGLAPAAGCVQNGSTNLLIFLGPVATRGAPRFSGWMEECMGPSKLHKHI